jgi:hypothetical protein
LRARIPGNRKQERGLAADLRYSAEIALVLGPMKHKFNP